MLRTVAVLAVLLAVNLTASAGELLVGTALVVDGDTLRLGETRVRLWGIDAPETGRPFADVATRNLRDLVAGRTLTCDGLDTDAYGRTVAECWISVPDGGGRLVVTSLGVAQVQAGLATGWQQFLDAHPERKPPYVAAEAAARRRRAGVWAGVPR